MRDAGSWDGVCRHGLSSWLSRADLRDHGSKGLGAVFGTPHGLELVVQLVQLGLDVEVGDRGGDFVQGSKSSLSR